MFKMHYKEWEEAMTKINKILWDFEDQK